MSAIPIETYRGDPTMITELNVATLMVLDKDEALDFYVDKLGLEKGNDVKQGDYRWLTVRVPATRARRLPRAAGPAAPRRSHRRAAARAHQQGRDGRARLPHGRRPGSVRDPQESRRDRLHPGAHRPLLRHGHGCPRPLRQPDPGSSSARRPPSRRPPDRSTPMPGLARWRGAGLRGRRGTPGRGPSHCPRALARAGAP